VSDQQIKTIDWQRELPLDGNPTSKFSHAFRGIHNEKIYMLLVDIYREGRMWVTNYYLAKLSPNTTYALEQLFEQSPSHRVKSRMQPVFDIECVAAKRWAESMVLTPMELLASTLSVKDSN